MNVQPYLMFPGTCREALGFYADVFRGSTTLLQTVGESPLPAPPEHADRVFNAVFEADDLKFRASDGEPGNDPAVGQNFALFVGCADAGEQQRVFTALEEGGRVLFPLSEGFGMVEDRFAFRWMITLAASVARDDAPGAER